SDAWRLSCSPDIDEPEALGVATAAAGTGTEQCTGVPGFVFLEWLVLPDVPCQARTVALSHVAQPRGAMDTAGGRAPRGSMDRGDQDGTNRQWKAAHSGWIYPV